MRRISISFRTGELVFKKADMADCQDPVGGAIYFRTEQAVFENAGYGYST
jgi:hypothetical protein